MGSRFTRQISEDRARELAPGLINSTKWYTDRLRKWGWTAEVIYRLGKPGTASAYAWVEAKRGKHEVVLEILYRLNSRKGPTTKFLGGFWDGGPIKTTGDLERLAKPLSSSYTPRGPQNNKKEDNKMATTKTTTTRKRAPRKAAEPIPEPEESTSKRPRLSDEEKAARAAEREQERQERYEAKLAEERERIDLVTELRDAGKTWDEVVTVTGINASTAQYLYLKGQNSNGKRPEATPEAIISEREAGMSYAKIQAKYGIGRQQVWRLMEEGGVDHFSSDIGKGGRFINRDPEKVAARQAAKASTGTKRGRRKAFKGFTDETADDEVMATIENKTIEWNKVRGEGTLTAKVKEGTISIVHSKAGVRGVQFNDGSKQRTVAVNSIVSVS